jgi:predicted esterase
VRCSILILVTVATFAPACSKTASGPNQKPVPVADGGDLVDAPFEEVDSGQSAVDAGPPTPPPWIAPVLPTRSAACGMPRVNRPGETFKTPSGRSFHVYAPANYDANTAYPVSLTFHGWYGTGPTFRDWFRMDEAVKNDGLTVYPDADGPLWDQVGTKDLLFFDEMMKQLSETYCINPSRVLGFGFSQGGIFMSQLGCFRAGYLKAIAVGDGSRAAPTVGCGRLPVIIVHRPTDQDEKFEWGLENKDLWAQRNECSTTVDAQDAMGCIRHSGCKTPGAVTFCRDDFFDASWPVEWNHTVRDVYRQHVWNLFKALP